MSCLRRRLWLLLLPLLLATAAHLGFRLFVVRWLETRQAQLAPDVRMEYGGLETSLSGRVVFTDLRLEGGPLPGVLKVARLELEGPSLPAYLLHNNPLAGFAAPRFLRLRGRGAVLELPVSAGDGCDPEAGLSPATFRGLGFRRLEGSFRGEYRHRPELSTLGFRMALEVNGIQRTKVEGELQNVTEEGFRNGHLATALLSTLMLRFHVQPAFGRLLVRHCAERRGLGTDAFRLRLAASLLDRLRQAGVAPASELREALLAFVRDWGTLELDMVPSAPIALAFLPFVPAEQLPERLGLGLTLNGRPVEGLRFRPLSAPDAATAVREGDGAAPRRLGLPRSRWRYRPVAPSALGRYLGHRVRLQERGDPVRSGVLVEVADGRATVEQRVQGGKFVAYLSLDDLVRAEVFVLQEAEETAGGEGLSDAAARVP